MTSSQLWLAVKRIVTNGFVTKADVGLSNVDNTSDADKPISAATQAALGNKVDVVAGKALSTNDYTTTEKNKVTGIDDNATANSTDAELRDRATHTGSQAIGTITGLQVAIDNKVDVEVGKGLSSNDYTTAEKDKLAGLESSRFKGEFANLAALQSGVASPSVGDYANVDGGASSDVERYVWDASDSAWVKVQGTSTALTASQIKTEYESNPDTNGFTDSEKTKLSGVAAGATNNADTDSLNEGSTNLYHTAARVRAVVLTGLSVATNAAIESTDNVLAALGKLQAQVTSKAGLASDNIFTGSNKFGKTTTDWQTGTYAATYAHDASNPSTKLTLAGNITFDSVANAGNSQFLFIEVVQDATGSRLASFNTANFEAAGGVFPTLSTAANARDQLTLARSPNGKWSVAMFAQGVS